MPYRSVAPEDGLRAVARKLITDGILPVTLSTAVSAGYGTGTLCRLCQMRIERDHVEYEITDARDGGSFSFHLICHAAWRCESDVSQVASRHLQELALSFLISCHLRQSAADVLSVTFAR